MSPRAATARLPDELPALALLVAAVDPHAVGGVVLRGRFGPTRDAWVAEFKRLLPASAPYVRLPVNAGAERVIGGLDFGATMAAGRPVFATGLLEQAHDGVLAASMAERMDAGIAATVSASLDSGEIVIEREGHARRSDARFGVIAFDEGVDDEAIDATLADRLALQVRLDDVDPTSCVLPEWSASSIASARSTVGKVTIDDESIAILTQTAAAFAIDSLRAVILAVQTARHVAALRSQSAVTQKDVSIAAGLVFPQRARALPQEPLPPEQEDSPADTQDIEQSESQDKPADMPEDVLVDAVRAHIPANILDALLARVAKAPTSGGGRNGLRQRSNRRGRPIGASAGLPTDGRRLDVLGTLKAAAPWQNVRRSACERPVEIRKDDLRVKRYEESAETTTIFAVDASGSQAAQRLAEVKGAIELLLKDSYVRRDQVALVAFRGTEAEAVLPPTRALARARRSLRSLPGGGGTPLAAGLDEARRLALAERHHGRQATIVLLTDGRANITRDGTANPEIAESDALNSGKQIAADQIPCVLVDASRRPRPRAQSLANAMHARYVPLPQADAEGIRHTVEGSVQ